MARDASVASADGKMDARIERGRRGDAALVLLLRRRARGEDAEVAVDLHAVGVDDFAAHPLGHGQRQRQLPLAVGPMIKKRLQFLGELAEPGAGAQKPRDSGKNRPKTATPSPSSLNPDDKPAYREALLILGRVALNRKLPPPDVLSGWEAAEWEYAAVDGELRQEGGRGGGGAAGGLGAGAGRGPPEETAHRRHGFDNHQRRMPGRAGGFRRHQGEDRSDYRACDAG